MIASVLYFLLGFLVATFVVLAAAPAVWRRAVALTEKRISATLPMSREEINAEKGSVRAEGAMAVRRVEIERDKFVEKSATLEADLNKERERIKDLTADCDDKAADIEQLESMAAEAQEEIETLTAEKLSLADRLEASMVETSNKIAELTGLSHQLSEAAVNLSNHEVELASREAELARQSESLRSLREKLRSAEVSRRDARSESKALVTSQKTDRKKIEDLEGKLDKLTAANAEIEEKLSRKTSDAKRLQSELREKSKEFNALARELKSSERQFAKLERDLAKAGNRPQTPTRRSAKASEDDSAVEKLEITTARLRKEIKNLKNDNAELAEQLRSTSIAPADHASGGDDVLREQIADIAARVVTMTEMVQGEASPINELLGKEKDQDTPSIAPGGDIIDLAERIRALQDKGR